MGISEDEVFADLDGHIRSIWNCMSAGFSHYRNNYPDLDIHRRSTRANIVNDLMFARIISAFDEVPGIRIIHKPNQLRFLSVSDRVTLWFKKRDGNQNTTNFPTPEALDRDGGQRNFFRESHIIVAGYHLNDEETAVKRISFSPPNLVKPRWFIDVEAMPQPIQMKGPVRVVPTEVRLQVAIGPKQIIL